MEIFSPYSVFRISIIQQGQGSLNATLKPDEFIPIEQKFRYCFQVQMDSIRKSEKQNLPSCYTKTFNAGSNKGRTPAQLLSQEGEKALNSQMEFLQKNLSRYPKNADLIRACQEAIQLSRQGKLMNTPNPWQYDLYSGLKSNGKKTRSGNTDYYQASTLAVRFVEGAKEPFSIEIMNCMAPLRIAENGLRIPLLSNVLPDSRKTASKNLSLEEMAKLIQAMRTQIDGFVNANYAKQYQLSRNLAYKNSQEREYN